MNNKRNTQKNRHGLQNTSTGTPKDIPRYGPVWIRLVILFMAPAFLLVLLFSLWCYQQMIPIAGSNRANVIGIAIFIFGEAGVIFFVLLVANYLVRRLGTKRKYILLMDQQLLKMSRLASETQLSQGFFRELKDKLSNIDTAAACAQDLALKNKLNELGETLSQIRSEALHSHKDIDKFLAFTRPPGSRWLIKEININQILDDLLGILIGELFLKSIRVHREYQDNLPAIRSNFSRLHQIFQNLFLAVIADIPDKSVVTLKTSSTPTGICVVLTYPSLNFDKHVVKKIFDPAWALQTKEPGPWLALCVHHVIRLNGTIDATETSEKMLVLTVELPYRLSRPAQ